MYSGDITEKFDPNAGVGLEFEFRNMKCITIPRDEFNLKIGVLISTFADIGFSAGHFYGTLNMQGLESKQVGHDQEFFTSLVPKEAQGMRIDVSKPDTKKRFDGSIRQTMRFDSIQEIITAIESEFDRLFGEPWKLGVSSVDQPWSEYKEEMLKLYSV